MRKALFLLLVTLILSSCASIVSESSYPVHITSEPEDTKVKIVDRNGIEVFNGDVPATVELEAGANFFKRQVYMLTFSAPGYVTKTIPLQCKVDGWYWGNLLLGGVIGMLIIDPATGAMYKLSQENISTTLEAEDTSMLIIRDIDELSSSERQQLEILGRATRL